MEELLVASNRGPVTFARDEHDAVHPSRGAGGLVTALTGAIAGAGGLWLASAMTEEDERQAKAGRFEVDIEGVSHALRYLSFEAETYDRYYNEISNRVLWFVHHYLWDTVHAPRFDGATREAWAAYREVNRAFATALAEEGGGRDVRYLIQDYHLSLVPAMLRERHPGARIAHFSHIPFAGPRYFGILPGYMRQEILPGLLGADVLGFQSEAWAEAFLLTCRTLPGASVDHRRRRVRWQGRETRVRVYPIAIDADALADLASSTEVKVRIERFRRERGERKLIVRVDRTELTKNILRGFLGFECFLLRYPEWKGRVRFLALLNPSRSSVPEYRAYTDECLQTAKRINTELGDGSWTPIDVRIQDDFDDAVAAYVLYDVLMVNPTFDGMNLVAKEGPAVNRHRGQLVLSRNTGAFQELYRHVVPVNPFDIDETAEALRTALEMPDDERARRSRSLRAAVRRNGPERWVAAQLADLRKAPSQALTSAG
jgi:trehalose 6-phosphate synthase